MTEHESGGPPAAPLHQLLLESEDITSFLDALTATVAQALSTDGDEVWCAVTLLRPKRSSTVASSSPAAEALDGIQYHYGDGPCPTASREHRLVHVADTRSDPRPALGPVRNRGVLRRGRSYPFRQSSLVRWEPACGPICTMPPSTTQDAPVT